MMIRTFIALSMSCSVAVAAATTPSSPPPATTARTSAPTTLPAAAVAAPSGLPQQLHEQAIDAMRLGQLDVALALMEKAYNATPPSQRTRPLVLNRAILDLTQQFNVMRAVREMYQYLRANPDPDEQAMNILGAALNATADTPRLKQGALWQSAYKEWERRNDKLNESRPGFRRWGPQWLDDEEHAQLQATRVELERAIEEQEAQTARAKRNYDEIQAQRARLASDIASIHNQLSMRNPPGRLGVGNTALPGGGVYIDQAQLDRVQLQRDENLREAESREVGVMREAEARAAAQLPGAKADLELEQRRLRALKERLAGLRPAWPTTFDPIDPRELKAPAIPPPDPRAVAALAEKMSKETARAKSPFNDPGAVGVIRAGGQVKDPAAPVQVSLPVTPQPSTGPAPVPAVPFGPREIDTQRR